MLNNLNNFVLGFWRT